MSAFSAGGHVGHVAEVVTAERRPDLAERTGHLVDNQEHVVLVADLADLLEIAEGGGMEPPAFCTGSKNTVAMVFGSSHSIASTVRWSAHCLKALILVSNGFGAR